MRKNKYLFIVLLSLALLMAACAASKKDAIISSESGKASSIAETEQQPQSKNTKYTNIKPINSTARENKPTYQIVQETYTVNDARSDITINYPQVVGLSDNERQNRINELIRKEAVLLSLPGRPASDERLLTVRSDYQIAWQSNNLLCIQYRGYIYVKGAPYSPDHLMITNIDIAKGDKLTLKDLVVIDEDFAEIFRNDNIRTVSPLSGTFTGKQVFVEFTPLNSVDDTVKRLKSADEVYSKGRSGTYCYFTPNAFGISTGVAHAIGDHAEFEIRYEDLAKHIKVDNEVWKDFFTGVGK